MSRPAQLEPPPAVEYKLVMFGNYDCGYCPASIGRYSRLYTVSIFQAGNTAIGWWHSRN